MSIGKLRSLEFSRLATLVCRKQGDIYDPDHGNDALYIASVRWAGQELAALEVLLRQMQFAFWHFLNRCGGDDFEKGLERASALAVSKVLELLAYQMVMPDWFDHGLHKALSDDDADELSRFGLDDFNAASRHKAEIRSLCSWTPSRSAWTNWRPEVGATLQVRAAAQLHCSRPWRKH
jgi:hypothetical protein